MAAITDMLKEVFQNKELFFAYAFEGKSTEVEFLIRKTLAGIHLRDAPSYTCKIEKVVVFDDWSLRSLVQRVYVIPLETWKRLAVFVSVLFISYIFHVSYKSYLSQSAIVGTVFMAGALYKTFQFAKNASYPVPFKATFSYKDWQKIEHEQLANKNKENNGVIDPFTLEVFPFAEVQSPKCIHLPNWILNTESCVYWLLENPQFKNHPIGNQQELSTSERADLSNQICTTFNLTQEELMSCWEDFAFSDADKEAFLKEKFLKDGKLTEDAQDAVETELGTVLQDTQSLATELVDHSIAIYLRSIRYLLTLFDCQMNLCAQASTDEQFQNHLDVIMELLHSFDPDKIDLQFDDISVSIDLKPSMNIFFLEVLRVQTESKFLENQGQSNPRRFQQETPQPSLERRLALIDTLIQDKISLEGLVLEPLMEVIRQNKMIFLFKATELFRNAILDAESKRRHQKFQELTGIDLLREVL